MNTNDITNYIVAALHENPTLNSTLAGWYGQEPTIFIGISDKERPSEEQCPAIEIDVAGGQAGSEEDDDGNAITTCYLGMVLTIHDETGLQSGLDRVKEWTGFSRRESFRRQVMNVLSESLDEIDVYIAAVEHVNNETEAFPFWQVTLAAALTQQVTLGTDPITA